MKCPHCGDNGQDIPVRCQACRHVYDRQSIEQVNHLQFMRARLDRWRDEGTLPIALADHAIQIADGEIENLLIRMGLRAAPVPTPVNELQTARFVMPSTPRRVTTPLPAVPAMQADLSPATTAPSTPIKLDADAARTGFYSARPRPVRPARPPFSWKKVGTYLLSERTLNGLLAVGAFLILAAAFIISTVNPTGLGPLPHLLMMLGTTAVFYGGGIVLKKKLNLARTGAALLAIGAGFIPLDSWTLGHEVLQLDQQTDWFIASLLCLPVFLISHLVLRGRPFAVFTSVCGASLALSGATLLGIPAPWAAAALVPLSMCYVIAGHRILREWDALAWALFWIAQVLTPLVLVALLAAKLVPEDALATLPHAWRTALLQTRGPGLEYAAGSAWWLGTILYAMTARVWHSASCARSAAWLLPLSYLLTLTKAPFGAAWYGFCLVPLAAAYICYGSYSLKTARNAGGGYAYKQLGRESFFQVALSLTVVAAAWPFVTFESQMATLAALILTFAGAAVLLRQRAWAYVATYLVVLLQIRQVTVPHAYVHAAQHLGLDHISIGLGFALASAAMLTCAELLVRRTGEARRPLLDTVIGLGTWRSLFGSPLFSAGYVCWALAVVFTVLNGTPLESLGGVDTLALLLVVALCAAGGYTRRTSLVLYPAAALFVLPLISLIMQFGRHLGYAMPVPSIARALALAAVGYLVLGHVLDRYRGHYAKPLFLIGYILGVATIALSAPDRAANTTVLALAIAAYGWSALEMHRDRHPSFQWLVGQVPAGPARVTMSLLFHYLVALLLPVLLVLSRSLVSPDAAVAAYGLMLALAAPAFVATGVMLGRIRREYRMPWYFAGYALSVLGPSLTANNTSVAALAVAMSVALYLASALHSGRSEWLWLVAVLTPVPALLLLSGVPNPLPALVLGPVLLALGYGLLGARLHYGTARSLFQPLAGRVSPSAAPFLVVGQALCAVGLLGAISYAHEGLLFATLALGSLHYAACLACWRKAFHWPLAFVFAGAYGVGVSMLPTYDVLGGIYLLPCVAGYLVGVQVLLRGRVPAPAPIQATGHTAARFSRASAMPRFRRGGLQSATRGWSAPFTLLGHLGAALTVAHIGIGPNQLVWMLLPLAVSTIYFGCAAVSAKSGWLYFGVGYGIVGYFAAGHLLIDNASAANVAVECAVLAWLLLGVASGVTRARGRTDQSETLVRFGASAWARPWIAWGAVVVASSSVICLIMPGTVAATISAVAYLALSLALALLWRTRMFVWGTLAYAACLCQQALIASGVPLVDQPLYWAGASFLAGTIAVALTASGRKSAALWAPSLFSAAVAGIVLSCGTSLGLAANSGDALQPLTITLTVSGATLLLSGVSTRNALMQIAGVPLLILAYVCELAVLHIAQPQAFALPAGMAMLVVAYLKWREDGSSQLKKLLEIAAITVLLGTSLLQAMGQLGALGNHYLYDTVLLLEGTAVFAIGAALRWTRTFFAAAAAIVASVLILLADPLRSLSVVYLALLIGCSMVALVVFMEQRRQQIPLWIDEVRLRLDAWG